MLILFTLEILAKVYANKFKVYFKNFWNINDFIIILLNIALVVVDLFINSAEMK